MKTKNHFLQFLKEIAIVVIGVLIAVSINKLKENIDNQNYISKTINAIEKEINYSNTEVTNVLSKHLSIVDSLTANLDNEEESLSELVFGLGGIQSAETKDIGLRFFVSTKAKLVEYEVIAQLSAIESASNLLDEKMKRLIDFLFIKIDKRDRANKENFLHHLKNVINSERRLLELYSKFSDKKTK